MGEIFRNEEVYNDQVKRGEVEADPEMDAEFERQKQAVANGESTAQFYMDDPVQAPADQQGGPVEGGQTVTVAEHGPETVVPSSAVGKVMAPPEPSSVEPAPGAETA